MLPSRENYRAVRLATSYEVCRSGESDRFSHQLSVTPSKRGKQVVVSFAFRLYVRCKWKLY